MKRILLIILVLAIAIPSFSQDRFGWGVKAGFNGSTFMGGSEALKIGFTGGVFVDYKLCKWFALSVDALYSSQGSGRENKVSLGYLNIPVMAKFYVANDFHLDIGPQVGILLNAKLKSEGNKTDIRNNVRKADFAIPVGAGYEFPFGLTVDVHGVVSLTKVYNDAIGNNNRNLYCSIMLGWRF